MPKVVSFEPAEPLLTGRLVRRIFPGPPNYESVAKGDQAERVLVLVLDHPIDVKSAEEPQDEQRNVREIQVMVASTDDPKVNAALEKLVISAAGRDVAVKAKLSVAMTGHQHTPVFGEILQLKRKGQRDFAQVARWTAEEKAMAEAEELARREKLLREAEVVDGAAPDADFSGDTRFVGTLVERRVRPASRSDWWIKDGEKICWILQLDRSITIREPVTKTTVETRELDVIFPFGDPLARRDLRALGVTARDAWDPSTQSLFGKRYRITGRLFPNGRFENSYAPARLMVDRLQTDE